MTTDSAPMSVGDRLKDIRHERKLSQRKLAAMCHISQTTISDIERGRNTSSKELPVIASALGVSAIWLATGKGARDDVTPLRPIAPERQINSDLMVAAFRAATAFRQQTGANIDDAQVLRLACRVYEQYVDTPERTSAEMLGYLVFLSNVLGKIP